MSTSLRVIKNTGYLYIKTLVSMFVMLYVTRIVLRSLGAEDFGIYDVVGGAISMLGFVNTSMASTVQRFLNNAQGQNNSVLQRKVYNIGVVFHITIAVLMVVVFGILYIFLFNGILNISPERMGAAKIVYLCLIVSTFMSIVTVPYDASINAHEDMLTYSVIGIIDIFLKLGVAIAIVHSTMDKLILYAVLMMAVPIATYIMMKIWCVRHYAECVISVKQYYDKKVARDMLSFSGWSLLGTTSNLVGNHGNNIVLNHFFGTTLNAVMGIANQFQGMLVVLSNGMLRSLNPVIYKQGATDSKRLMQYSYMGCKYSFLLLAFFALPVIIETSFVLNIWLGQVPEWSVLFVRLQLIRCLLEQLTTTFNKSLQAVGKIKENNIAIFVFNLLPIGVLSVVYGLGFSPYWHYIIAIIFMVIAPSIIKIYYCKRYCNLSLPDFLKQVISPCSLCFILPLAVGIILKHTLMLNPWVGFAVVASITVISFCLVAYFSLGQSEKIVLSELMKKVIELRQANNTK